MNEEYLTVAEVAAKLRVTPKTVYDLMRSGQLSYVQIGIRKRRIAVSALDRFLRDRERGIDQGSYTDEKRRKPTMAAVQA